MAAIENHTRVLTCRRLHRAAPLIRYPRDAPSNSTPVRPSMKRLEPKKQNQTLRASLPHLLVSQRRSDTGGETPRQPWRWHPNRWDEFKRKTPAHATWRAGSASRRISSSPGWAAAAPWYAPSLPAARRIMLLHPPHCPGCHPVPTWSPGPGCRTGWPSMSTRPGCCKDLNGRLQFELVLGKVNIYVEVLLSAVKSHKTAAWPCHTGVIGRQVLPEGHAGSRHPRCAETRLTWSAPCTGHAVGSPGAK